MDLKGSKTGANLQEAFSGESQARNKYTFYASVAKKAGYEQIAAIFEETAGNEREHAKMWFKELGQLGDTAQSLKDAAAGEHFENTEMYPRMAKEAQEEGFTRLSKLFELVGSVEKHHEERYLKLLDNLEKDKIFKRDTETVWMCRNCGYLHTGKDAPKICPTCQHPQAFFQIDAENY